MLALIMLSLYFGLFICFILYMHKLSKIKRSFLIRKKRKVSLKQNRKTRNVKQKQ